MTQAKANIFPLCPACTTRKVSVLRGEVRIICCLLCPSACLKGEARRWARPCAPSTHVVGATTWRAGISASSPWTWRRWRRRQIVESAKRSSRECHYLTLFFDSVASVWVTSELFCELRRTDKTLSLKTLLLPRSLALARPLRVCCVRRPSPSNPPRDLWGWDSGLFSFRDRITSIPGSLSPSSPVLPALPTLRAETLGCYTFPKDSTSQHWIEVETRLLELFPTSFSYQIRLFDLSKGGKKSREGPQNKEMQTRSSETHCTILLQGLISPVKENTFLNKLWLHGWTGCVSVFKDFLACHYVITNLLCTIWRSDAWNTTIYLYCTQLSWANQESHQLYYGKWTWRSWNRLTDVEMNKSP